MSKHTNMNINLSKNEIKVIRTALYHQYYRITNDNGKAVGGYSQEMANATYDTLIRFQQLDMENQEESEIQYELGKD